MQDQDQQDYLRSLKFVRAKHQHEPGHGDSESEHAQLLSELHKFWLDFDHIPKQEILEKAVKDGTKPPK